MSTAEAPAAGQKIHAAILAVMREIGPIAKSAYNEQQKFNYRSVDAIYNRAQPLFIENGLFIAPGEILQLIRESKATKSGGTMNSTVLRVKYNCYAADGSTIVVESAGEGMDSGDKATSKAMTMAHKTAVLQLLMIPIAADPDGQAPQHENPEHKADAPKAAPRAERIEKSEIVYLLNEWKVQNPDDSTPEKWAAYVQEKAGREFKVGASQEWTRSDATKVARALGIPE